MDDKTTNDVADFIINKQQKNKRLFLQFFGSEPLCIVRANDITSKKLAEKGLLNLL